MAVEQIRGFRYKCDKCGTDLIQENATGQYHNGAPDGWAKVYIKPGIGPDFDVLLCNDCVNPVLGLLPRITDDHVEDPNAAA